MTTVTETARYGTAAASAWGRLHPRLTSRAAWEHHDGELPVIEGTLIRLQVDHLPGDRHPKPAWLWSSAASLTPAGVDLLWQAFLRRFDLEHTFRLFKQVLGWTAPKIRDPAAADRWTWLIIACHAQLRLARPLAADIRLPWQRPCPPGRLTPARVRRDFRNIRAITGSPAGAPKSGKPGPGRPPGSCKGPRLIWRADCLPDCDEVGLFALKQLSVRTARTAVCLMPGPSASPLIAGGCPPGHPPAFRGRGGSRQDGRDRGEHGRLCPVVAAVQEERLGRAVAVQLRLDERHGVQRGVAVLVAHGHA